MRHIINHNHLRILSLISYVVILIFYSISPSFGDENRVKNTVIQKEAPTPQQNIRSTPSSQFSNKSITLKPTINIQEKNDKWDKSISEGTWALANWTKKLAGATILLVVVTYIALIAQIIGNKKSFNLQKGLFQAQMYNVKIERWDSPEFRRRRRALANQILLNSIQFLSNPILDEEIPDSFSRLIQDVIDFFEDIGLSLKKGNLDEEVVWHGLSEAIICYWCICFSYVQTIRGKENSDGADESYYKNFQFLYDRMVYYSIKNKSNYAYNENELRTFLSEERSLNTEN